MTLDNISTYLKCRARAESPGTPEEGETAKLRVAEMEEKYPGIAAAAQRVARAVSGEEKAPPRPNWANVVEAALGAVAAKATTQFTDELSGHLSGAARFEPLQPRHFKVTTHQCAPGQVCIEVRMNALDVHRPRVLERILEAVGSRLRSEAE